MAKKQRKKREFNIFETVWFWTIFSFGCACLCIVFALFQIREYEKGILEIYANQQDDFVQLILDQININKIEEDPEVILNILGTLDTSVNKYWTLTHDEILIFVKDVLETNKYRGFTSSSYYISDSAQRFLANLEVNRVRHATVLMDDRRFIASGVVFQYRGEEYQICLLTNPEVVLDQNEYLTAKVNLGVMLFALLVLFVFCVIVLSRVLAKRNAQLKKEKEAVKANNSVIESLNEQLSKHDMYDVRKSLFQIDYLPMLFAKLQDREIKKVTFLLIQFADVKARETFLNDSVLMMNRRIMRFRDGREDQIILLAIGQNETQARRTLDWLLYDDIEIKAVYSIENVSIMNSDEALENLYSRVDDDAEQTL